MPKIQQYPSNKKFNIYVFFYILPKTEFKVSMYEKPFFSFFLHNSTFPFIKNWISVCNEKNVFSQNKKIANTPIPPSFENIFRYLLFYLSNFFQCYKSCAHFFPHQFCFSFINLAIISSAFWIWYKEFIFLQIRFKCCL